MPGYRTHLCVAWLFYPLIVWATWQNIGNSFVYVIGFCMLSIGALFPDIDIKSKGQNYLYLLYAIILAIVLCLYFLRRAQLWIDIIICIALATIAPMLMHHRGITHSPLFILGSGFVLWVFGAGLWPVYTQQIFFYSCCFVCGAWSHVWLDKKKGPLF